MVTVQEAFHRAVAYAREVLGGDDFTLEEVERDRYKDKDVWCITLGFPKRRPVPSELARVFANLPREYKTFFINADDGEVVAMKIRELAV